MHVPRVAQRSIVVVLLIVTTTQAGAQQVSRSEFPASAALKTGALVRMFASGEHAEGTVTSIDGTTVVLKGRNVLTAGYPLATVDSVWTPQAYSRHAWREGMKVGMLVGVTATVAAIAVQCSEGGCDPSGIAFVGTALTAVGGVVGALVGSAFQTRKSRWQLVHPAAR